ncbi:arylamine N-acetyltransferase family protein [Bacillus coahuilensis]|uniref:arylamine N-acetyltransferase family protein n=1 Tax=Bacillus coahuilensis TaxID=408580 RepID=UPI0001850739|nr:arylamine N-acetyltransferase [Bacillus coahuilensis]
MASFFKMTVLERNLEMISKDYLTYIGITDYRNLSQHELLSSIHQQHLYHIPFENLDIHVGKKLSMNPEEVIHKILGNHRGGLCFEVNSLLYSVLKELFYDVHYISARFWNEDKQSWNRDCSHLALMVNIEDHQYLVDVGVGGGFLTPLLIQDRCIHLDHHGEFKVEKTASENEFIIVKRVEEQWERLFKISTTPRALHEFEEMCEITQTDRDSIFTQKKLCSLMNDQGRVSLTDQYIKKTSGGEVVKKDITSQSEWILALKEHFTIDWKLIMDEKNNKK